LYGLLEVLDVRRIINRHCPTADDVDHGTVAVVMILNRMVAPRPLYHVADWIARTVLVYTLGVPAEKFNDDRLGQTLDAISQHSHEIWQDIVHRALVQADVDLAVIFYDLTAFIAHGAYANSEIVDFGFRVVAWATPRHRAHNTPMNKRKIEAGLNVTADGCIPTEYAVWSGRTADMATVQENMERLRRLLERHGWPVGEVVVVGDHANLNDELAFAYDDHDLRYLAGLKAQGKSHRELLLSPTEAQFRQYPLNQERGRNGYWGVPCQVIFEHDGRQVTHKGLVVLSGPMRSSLRRERATQLRTLRQELRQIQTKISRPWYRTAAAVQQHAHTVLKNSPVGKLVRAETQTDEQGQIHQCRWIDRATLLQAIRKDGRYLLATNNWSLSPQRMFDLYRQKDAVEKRFHVSKSDLKVSPIRRRRAQGCTHRRNAARQHAGPADLQLAGTPSAPGRVADDDAAHHRKARNPRRRRDRVLGWQPTAARRPCGRGTGHHLGNPGVCAGRSRTPALATSLATFRQRPASGSAASQRVAGRCVGPR
jgi:transposase